MMKEKHSILYYAHDPMCSWCWGFRPAWIQLQLLLPDIVRVVKLVGGLAADSDQPMPLQMQHYLRQTWQSIEQRIPGTRFNYDFWEQCLPRRSTYPACRAVIAAAHWGKADEMTHAIQQAYYLQARNPSDEEVLVALATQLDIDAVAYTESLHSEQVRVEMARQFHRVGELGVGGFPGLVLEHDGATNPIAVQYTDPQAMLNQCVTLLFS